MTNTKIITVLLVLTSAQLAFGQDGYLMKGNEEFVEIDFLSSYYDQDGNNGAVTGGIGTEKLTDFANILIVNIPIDSSNAINFSAGLDIYSSASTDNIDNNRSSASSMDARSYVNVAYSKKQLTSGFTYGARVGFSTEYDYNSINGGINISKEFDNGNTEFAFSGQAFIDNWITYFPQELRGVVSVPTKSRNSFNGQLTWSQVLNKRLQMSFSLEAIYMEGLLSTPFHRVYFSDQSLPDIERLPSSRLKIPLALRLNYKPMDNLILRTYYRFYSDDFGIIGHTANIEVPIHISDSWTIAPFYRFHTQSGADYFLPYAEHISTNEFYTSDYDLSELSSHKYGLGLSYSPLYGLARMKLPFTKNVLMIKDAALRVARYTRNTGLSGYSIAFGLSIRI